MSGMIVINPKHTENLRNAIENIGLRPVLEMTGGGYHAIIIELDVVTGEVIVVTNSGGSLPVDGEIHTGWMAYNYPNDESWVFGTNEVTVYDNTLQNDTVVSNASGEPIMQVLTHVDSKHDSMLLAQAIDAYLTGRV